MGAEVSAATLEQGHPLSCPGTIPGLLRECSPVWVRGLPREAILPGVVLEVRAKLDEDTHDVLVAVSGRGCFWWPSRLLDLRLDVRTGRTHAAWWLLTVLPSRSYRRHDNADVRLCRMFGSERTPPVVYLTIGDSYCGGLVFVSRPVGRPSYLRRAFHVPLLAGFNEVTTEQWIRRAPDRALQQVVAHYATHGVPT